MPEEKDKTDKNPVPVPQIAGRNYNNFKNYLGITSLPSFSLKETIHPVFDLSTNVDPNTELKFGTLQLTAEEDASSRWSNDEAGPTVLSCPDGQEHLYLYLNGRLDSFNAGVAVTAKWNVFVGNGNQVLTPVGNNLYTAPSPDPNAEPSLVLIKNQSTAVEQFILDHDVLPIYVPPRGYLVMFPYEVTAALFASANPYYYVQYVRVERTAGLGPLVK